MFVTFCNQAATKIVSMVIFARQVFWSESSEPVQATGASEILAIIAVCVRICPEHSKHTWTIDEPFWFGLSLHMFAECFLIGYSKVHPDFGSLSI